MNAHTENTKLLIMKRQLTFLIARISAALALFAVLGYPAFAGELSKISWWQSEQVVLKLFINDSPPIATETLNNGKRLRIKLAGTTLGNTAVDLAGRGAVKSAFPYLSDDGKSVYVDLLLNSNMNASIDQVSDGILIHLDSVETGSSQAAIPQNTATNNLNPVAVANKITDIKYSVLAGGRIQINIETSQRPREPGRFSTHKPARLALDFFGARNHLSNNNIKIGKGPLEGIHAVETDERTRIVFDLVRSVPYQTQLNDDGLVIVLENPSQQIAQTVATHKTTVTHFSRSEAQHKHSIKRIDFRRGKDGGGKVIIDLSGPSVGVDITEQSGEIIVDFLNTSISSELEQRLDVVDFATPVQTIDAFQQNDKARMVITPGGQYQHLAYQTGNIFTIHVNKIREQENEVAKDEFGYTGDRLSLSFQKIKIRSALQVLADFTNLNIVASDSVEGELSLILKDVPWDQALDVILQAGGLGMRQKGNVIWVAPTQEIADKERLELEANKTVSDLEPLTSELIPINYAKAEDIANLLKSIKAVDTGVKQSVFGSISVSKVETESNTLLSERGSVTIDERTNSILVQDTPAKIREVRKLIAQLDKPVRQVMIETRIVEATDTFSKNLGVRLGFQRITEQAHIPGISDSNIGTVITSGSFAGATTINNSLVDDEPGLIFDTQPDGLAVDLGANGIGADRAAQFVFDIFKAGTGYAHLIDLELSALQAEGLGKIIANPRLITANQKEAHIEQGQERIFRIATIGDIGNLVTKKAVLGLTVTPQITPDNRIIMDVFITQDTFASATDDTINTKQIQTQVLVDNGETVVIGGIYQQQIQNDVTKVPFLGDLPLIGNLFRKKSKLDDRRELLIFLTPRVLSPSLNL